MGILLNKQLYYVGVVFVGSALSAIANWKSVPIIFLSGLSLSQYILAAIVLPITIITLVSSIFTYRKFGTKFILIAAGISNSIALVSKASISKYNVFAAFVVIAFQLIAANIHLLMNPLYISHISPENTRDSYGILHFVGIIFGTYIGNHTLYTSHRKIFLYVFASISLIQSILIWFIPNITPEITARSNASKEKKYIFHSILLILAPLIIIVEIVISNATPEHISSYKIIQVNNILQIIISIILISIAFSIYFFGLRIHWIISSAFSLIFLIICSILAFTGKRNMFSYGVASGNTISLFLGLNSVGLSLICQFSDNLIFFSQILYSICSEITQIIYIFSRSKIWLIVFVIFDILFIIYGIVLFPDLKANKEKEKYELDAMTTPII